MEHVQIHLLAFVELRPKFFISLNKFAQVYVDFTNFLINIVFTSFFFPLNMKQNSRFAYGTSKAAVIGLTKSLAADLVGRRVSQSKPEKSFQDFRKNQEFGG